MVASCALAMAIASVGVALTLRLWDWSPFRPLAYASDALFYEGVVKGTLDNGWYLHNPRLGAPAGQNFHDFPVVGNDSLQLLIVKVLGLFSDNAIVVTNGFYLLTYPLTAAVAFLCLTRLDLSRGTSVVAASLYALAPYHFMKGGDQLFFTSYYLVPLSCLLAYCACTGEPLVRRTGWRSLIDPVWPAGAATALVALALSGASIYYAVFTLILLACGATLRMLGARSLRASLPAIVAIALLAGGVALNQVPVALYRLEHGANELVANRDPFDTEYFALKLNQMVFPVPGHRLDALENITDNYLQRTRLLGEPASYLGSLGSMGLFLLLAIAIAGAAGARVATRRDRLAAALGVVAFLVATTGGVSAVIGYTLTSQIRTWARMSIFIAFFALVAWAGVVDWVRRRLSVTARGIAGAVLPAVLVVGFLDQTTPRMRPELETFAGQYVEDHEFVAEIERRLPAGSAVLQLPHVTFPEDPGTGTIGPYDPIRGYLHSSELRWSFGAMKGRPEDWLSSIGSAPLATLLDVASAAGFRGVWVDRRGYGDDGERLAEALTTAYGAPLVHGSGRFAFWTIGPSEHLAYPDAARRSAAAETITRPVVVTAGTGFSFAEGSGEDRGRWAEDRASLEVVNTAPGVRKAWVRFTLDTSIGASGTTRITYPDGTSEDVAFDENGKLVAKEIEIPAGRSVISFETEAPQIETPPGDERRLFVYVRGPLVLPSAACSTSSPACVVGPYPQVP